VSVPGVPPVVYVSEHVANDVVPDRVHVPVNVPVPLVDNITVPVGVTYDDEVSVTVTVQLVAVPIVAGDVHEIDVATVLSVTVIDVVASGLAAECPASPP
jgi:hypothetical protein